jgi:hypothetical protein
MPKHLKQLLESWENNLPTHSLGYKTQVPDKLGEGCDDLEEDASLDALPTHSLGYSVEVPEGDVEQLAGGEELRIDDLTTMDDLIESDEKEEDLKEEDEEDLEKMAMKEARAIRKKLKEADEKSDDEEELKEEEDKSDDEDLKESDDKDSDDEEDLKEEADKDSDEEDLKEEDDKSEDEDLKEGLNALFSGQKLSKSFKNNVGTLFTAILKKRLKEERAILKEAYAKASQKQLARKEQKMAESVENFLDYQAAEWLKENRIAIESTLRNQLAESVLKDLRAVFENHHIELPDAKIDMVEKVKQEKAEVVSKLNEEHQKAIKLAKMVRTLTKEKLIREAASGMTDADTVRLNQLAEGLDFVSSKDFSERLNVLKKSLFVKNQPKQQASQLSESVEEKIFTEPTYGDYRDSY